MKAYFEIRSSIIFFLVLRSSLLCLPFLLTACGGSNSGDSGEQKENLSKKTQAVVPRGWVGRPPINIVWPDKNVTINGSNVTYRFGDGNPLVVALKKSDYMATSAMPGIPYVTPVTEVALLDFLSDKILPIFLMKCSADISKYNDESDPYFPTFDASKFNINNILIVDQQTGRKEIAGVLELNVLFQHAVGNEVVGFGFAKKCLSNEEFNSLESLKKKFSSVTRSYFNTFPKE